MMSTIEELEAKVKSLNPKELAEFREWFHRYEDVTKTKSGIARSGRIRQGASSMP